ncbi:MAG: ATP-binding protein, partial [Sutterella sp.]
KAEAPQRAPIRVLPLVEHAVADLKTTGRYSASIRLVAEADPVVFADPLEIELVALNLIKNALQALSAEGSGGKVHVTLGEEGERAALTVSDNGSGVTEDTVRRLMTSLESTKAEGLGLGLSIVRGILEAYGGKLTFAKREEGGLIARVTFPVWRDAAGREDPAAADQPGEK